MRGFSGNLSARVGLLLGVLAGGGAAAGGISVGPEITLPDGGPGQGIRGEPDVAFGRALYFVVWREGWQGDGGASRIYAARVDSGGKLLDSQGIILAEPASGVQDRPRVAYDGRNFLVVWEELAGGKQYDVRAVRVSPGGKVLDRAAIAVATGPQSEALPDVAADGKGFVVVWQGATVDASDTVFEIHAAPVSDEGKVGEARALMRGGVPLIAWDGHSHLVFANPTWGIRLDEAAKPVGAAAKPLWSPINMDERTFSIAGSPDGWLLVFDRSQPDYWGWAGPGAMRFHPVAPDGSVPVDLVREPAGVKERLPHWLDLGRDKKDGAGWPSGASAVAWDGKRYVAVWQRCYIEKAVMFRSCDIVAGRVEALRPLDPDGVGVAVSDADEKAPALASDGAGRLLSVFEKIRPDGRIQIGGRLLKTE